LQASMPSSSEPLTFGVTTLKLDRTHGASFLATSALRTLLSILQSSGKTAQSAESLWRELRLAAWALRQARPSMGAAISSALVHALGSVREAWEAEFGKSEWMQADMDRCVHVAEGVLERVVKERRKCVGRVGGAFAGWLKGKVIKSRPVRILTLSASGTIKSALVGAVRGGMRIDLRVLESRPRFEGAVFALALRRELEGMEGELEVHIATDSSVALLARDVDVVLLAADRISGAGDVSNKIGSLPAAICAKTLSPSAQVVVVSETDKIARPGAMEEHADEENEFQEVTQAWHGAAEFEPKKVRVRNVYFEWIPSKWVDLYICETGVLSRERVHEISLITERLEKELFGSLVEPCDSSIIKESKAII
jgi:translation initiation factor 2B subunit (eIF-2B alpha/beta/delta family)